MGPCVAINIENVIQVVHRCKHPQKVLTNMSTKFDKPLPKNYSSCRELRNLAEKQRRDKLNHYVNELSTLVPYVAEQKSQKRVDKISVLRLAASYIRLHKILDNEKVCFPTKCLSHCKTDASQTLLQGIGGFLLVVSSSGKVIYASEAVQEAFGYTQTEILGQSFFQFIHEDDKKLFRAQLKANENLRRSFYCRMLEKSSRSEPIRYEIIHVVGTLKKMLHDPPQLTQENEKYHKLRPRKRSISVNSVEIDDEENSTGEEQEGTGMKSVDSHMLVSFIKIVRDRPITEVSWVESTKEEYITRHLVDGTIAHVDHRISFVVGMMPEEVLGQLAYGYIHQEDVIWSLLANRKMFFGSEGQVETVIRLAGRNGKYVTLRSRGFLEVNKTTGEIDSFVCINTIISKVDAEKEMLLQRNDMLVDLKNEPIEDFVEKLAAQLPPKLFNLLKKLLAPNIIKKILQSANNLNLEDHNSMTIQAEHLSRKLTSLNSHAKISPEEIQFTDKFERNSSVNNTLGEEQLIAVAKRQKLCFSQSRIEEVKSINLPSTSNEDEGKQHTYRRLSIDSCDSYFSDASSYSCTQISPYHQAPNEISQHNLLNHRDNSEIFHSSSYSPDFSITTNTVASLDSVVTSEIDSFPDTNLISYIPPITENNCSYLENSSNNYFNDITDSNNCSSFYKYNSDIFDISDGNM